MVLSRPQKRKRTRLLREVKATLQRRLHLPVETVVQKVLNPLIRGWVNYFRWQNAGYDLNFVRWQVETKIRRFASRQRPKRRGGRSWTSWTAREIYEEWRLFSDYHVAYGARPASRAT